MRKKLTIANRYHYVFLELDTMDKIALASSNDGHV